MRVKVKGKSYRLNTRNIALLLGLVAVVVIGIWLWSGISEGVSCNFDRSQISWWNPLHIRDFFGIQ